MTKHSKNRTAAPVFSYHERQVTQYGSKKQRLGRDSMRNFDACALCLQKARDARMCDDGHIFCQECIVKSLLAQKKEIKRQQILLDKMREEEEQERQLVKQKARERVLQDFERLQSGTALSAKAVSNNAIRGAGSATVSAAVTDRGRKRKFELDDDEINRLADEQEEQAVRDIEREQAEKRKAKLPNFWLPSLTPDAAPTKLTEVKLQTLCHASDPAHPVSLKSLTIINFHRTNEATGTAATPATSDVEYTCPTCRRTLSNNVLSYALKPCGHVLCGTCIDTLVRPSSPMQCAHCEVKLVPTAKHPIIALQREGTGYAGGGMAEAKRFGLAFQA